MNDATAQNQEREKRAAQAWARGFLDHAQVGLNLSPEAAGERYKRASVIHRNVQTKFASLFKTIRDHIGTPAKAS